MAADPKHVKDIFMAVSEVAADGRAALLDRECAGDGELRQRVEALLLAHEEPDSFLRHPAPGHPQQTGAYAPSEQPGAVVADRYKLLEAIGEGGMGTVWVAEQTQPVLRKVALKLIKTGMDSRNVLARFEAERQALALMDHPNVAKVFDGGLTETGRPFFVMEYVKGVPITEYCDATRLSVPERLQLFTQVCHAVQHAHHKGIIHRDLKPSNILVAPYDDRPVPKIIDFGLAKAMHQSLTDRTLHTAHGTVLGTPLYMSPEQAQLNNLDIDTRSDIYSLGVLLYELLTGTTPLDRKCFKQAAWDEMRRLIREEEPPRPSARLSSSDTLPSLAACRQTEALRLTRLLRGDLDWIVMKALEKDRTRRYDTAAAFAADVRRFLAEEPIEARPPSPWYRFRKLARRNRVALRVAAVVAAVLLVGIAVSAWQRGASPRPAEPATRAEADAVASDAPAVASPDPTNTNRNPADATSVTIVPIHPIPGDDNPAGAPAKSFPLELVSGMRHLSQSDRLALSPDGKHVAYTVVAPTRVQGGRQHTGALPMVAGHQLFVADVASGKVTRVSGEKSAAWAASWSPDGTTVAFYSDEGGEVGLWHYRVGTATASRLGKVVVRAAHHMRPEWTPDGKQILVPAVTPATRKSDAMPTPPTPGPKPSGRDKPPVVVRTTGGERTPRPMPKEAASPPAVGQSLVFGAPAALLAVSATDGSTAVVLPAGDRPTFLAAKLSPSGKYLACESAIRTAPGRELQVLIDLTLVRRADGKVLHAVEGVRLDLNIDPTLPTLVPMAWHPSEDRLAYLHGGKLLVVDAAAETPLPKELSLGVSNRHAVWVTFTRDGNAVLVSVPAADSSVEDPSLSHVRLIPLGDGRPRDLLAPVGVKLRGVVSADWRTAWQPAPEAVVASGVETASGSQVFVRMPIDGKPATVAARVAGQMRVAAAALDHRRAVARVENATTAPDWFTIGPDFKPGVRLSRAEPRLEGVNVGPVESFTTTIRTSDGKERTVRSAVALPPGGKKGDRFPTIVTLYPGMNLSGQARSFGGGSVSTLPAAVFTTRGYAVLLADAPLSPHGVPSNPLEDIRAVVLPQVKRAAELGYTDINRVGVTGHSYGGYGTACLVCDTTVFKAAVPMNGMYDLPGIYAAQRADEPDTDGLNLNMVLLEKHQGRMGKPLWDDPKRYIDNSPYFRADRIRTPVLLIHGREDTNCPVGEAEKLFNALVRLERTAQLAIYPGEGHVPAEWANKNRRDVTSRTVAFFDRYVKSAKK